MTQAVIAWVVLGIVTLALALYRKHVSMREDVYVHIAEGEQRMIPEQVATFKKLGSIDRWGITLTIVTALFGLALAIFFGSRIQPAYRAAAACHRRAADMASSGVSAVEKAVEKAIKIAFRNP